MKRTDELPPEEDGALGRRARNSLVETLRRRQLAAVAVRPRRSVDVRVQALGVADVLEDPGSEVREAGVLGQNQTGPGVALRHVQGGDGHGPAHLAHNQETFYDSSGFLPITETNHTTFYNTGDFLPAQISLECIWEGMTEVEVGLPDRCHGRQVGSCSWFSLCCSCTPTYN